MGASSPELPLVPAAFPGMGRYKTPSRGWAQTPLLLNLQGEGVKGTQFLHLAAAGKSSEACF